jgi:HSP20 family protein
MELPGVAEDDIDIRIERNSLSVTAERNAEHRDDDDQIVCERAHFQVSRQLYLGEDVATDDVQATYDRGVLTLRIPVAEERQPRRIQVGGAGRQQAIDVDSTERSSSGGSSESDAAERSGETG